MSLIHVDCDGVLKDFVGAVCAALIRENPEGLNAPEARYVPGLFRDYDMRKALTGPEQDAMHRACTMPGFCLTMPWYPGALEWLQEVRHRHTVNVLTAPFKGAEHWTEERRAALRGHVDSVTFCNTENKADEPGDLLIEDRRETCNAWSEKQGKISFLLDRPWNRGGVLNPYVKRIQSLPTPDVIRWALRENTGSR